MSSTLSKTLNFTFTCGHTFTCEKKNANLFFVSLFSCFVICFTCLEWLKHKVVKISNFGTFHIRFKKSRVGRNPKTKEEKIIKERNVVLFKPSKDFKNFINENNEKKLKSL